MLRPGWLTAAALVLGVRMLTPLPATAAAAGPPPFAPAQMSVMRAPTLSWTGLPQDPHNITPPYPPVPSWGTGGNYTSIHLGAAYYPAPAPLQAPMGDATIAVAAGGDNATGVWPGLPVAPNFLGISLDMASAGNTLTGGRTSTPPNSIKNRTVAPDQAVVNVSAALTAYLGSVGQRARVGPRVRLGGRSQDLTIFNNSAGANVTMPIFYDLPNTSTAPGASAAPPNQVPGAGAGNPARRQSPPSPTPHTAYTAGVYWALRYLAQSIGARFSLALNMGDFYGAPSAQNWQAMPDQVLEAYQTYLASAVDFFEVGYEPDMYNGTSSMRSGPYPLSQYMTEWNQLTNHSLSSLAQRPTAGIFAGPAVCCRWNLSYVLGNNTDNNYIGLLQAAGKQLAAATYVHYPQKTCKDDGPVTLQGMSFYQDHTQTVLDSLFPSQAALAQVASAGVPLVLLETSTGQCGGLAGISDGFISALWAIDKALSLASNNHSGMFLANHGLLGGTPYLTNLITPPHGSNITARWPNLGWMTSPSWYSLLFTAEALASTADSPDPSLRTWTGVRVADLHAPNGNTAAYGIWDSLPLPDNWQSTLDPATPPAANPTTAPPHPDKYVLINMAQGQPGAPSDTWTATVAPPSAAQANVTYKLLAAPSLNAWGADVTWANQTFGYWSNGTLWNDEVLHTAPCTNGACAVPVPVPGAALVFATDATAAMASIPAFQAPPPTSPYQAPQGTQPLWSYTEQFVLDSNGGRGTRTGSTSNKTAETAKAMEQDDSD